MALLLAAALPVWPAGAGPLTSGSPFPSSARPDPPTVAAPVPRFRDRPRAEPMPPSAGERIRRRDFERRARAGGVSFGEVLLEHRRRR